MSSEVGAPVSEVLAETVGVAVLETEKIIAGVVGTMDGERPPMNKVEEIKHALEPYQKKYGHYLGKMRPWRQFCALSRPNGDIRQRLEANLTHYQINYAAIFLVLMIASMVMNPKCIVVVAVLAIIWVAFLRKNDDPEWQVAVGGVQLGKTQRWMVLTAATAIVLLSVVGQMIFNAAFVCGVGVILHAILRAPEDQEAVQGTPEEKQEMV